MSKKTEANLDKIRKLQEQVKVDVSSVGGFGTYHLETSKVVRMILDHLGLAYESGMPTTPKIVKVLKK